MPCPARGGCCGALHVHAGLHDDAVALAERVMASMPGDAPILVNSAGCGAAMKDYGDAGRHRRCTSVQRPRPRHRRVAGRTRRPTARARRSAADGDRAGSVPPPPRPAGPRAGAGAARPRRRRGRTRRRRPLLRRRRCVLGAAARTRRPDPRSQGGVDRAGRRAVGGVRGEREPGLLDAPRRSARPARSATRSTSSPRRSGWPSR